MTNDQLEVAKIAKQWSEVRLLSREEAAKQLTGEWLDAYNRYYEKYDKHMEFMVEVARKVQSLEPPKIQKKTEGQKKRDRWAKVQAREAARAAAAAALKK